VNQIFADLLREYRSSEMGAATLSVFRFYKDNSNDIDGKYKEIYDEQIKNKLKGKEHIDYSQTLHFQRRLIAQFYSNLAYLRYTMRFPRLSTKQLRYWFTPNEVKLLGIILPKDKAKTPGGLGAC
jgi:hypothetical protein